MAMLNNQRVTINHIESHKFTMKIPRNPYEIPMNSTSPKESADAPAQAESGEPQREPGRPSGFTMGLQWVYNGFIMGVLWSYIGIEWIYGFIMDYS
jgi:hypothetical protein